MKTFLSTALVFLICAISVVVKAQQKVDLAPSPVKQWEYLVLSFGKTTFFDPVADPELKQNGMSKIIAFTRAGIVMASEAVTTQNKMDCLGRFGWELVGVVGSIGGDQEMLFKRPFDPNRSVKEAGLIKAEGERIAEAQRKRRANQVVQKAPDDMVDLDEAERQRGVDVEAKLLMDDIMGYKDFPIKIISLDPGQDDNGKFTAIIIIQVDCSSKLLRANSYRATEAQALAKEVADKMETAAKLENIRLSPLICNVTVFVSVIVTHGGTQKEVAYRSTGGDRPWSDGKDKHP